MKTKIDIVEILRHLSVLWGPSTREMRVQQMLQKLHEAAGHEVKGDAQGNLFTVPSGKGRLRCGLVAHADEIGIQITSVEEPGIGRFRKLGGLRSTSLVGQRIKFVKPDGRVVRGIVCSDPMQDNGTDTGLLIKTSDLWVDVGAETVADFERRLPVGTFGAFDNDTLEILSEHRLAGKALDDRCGLAVVMEAFEECRELPLDLVMVSTVQEELSLYGAKALPIDLDAAIVVDVDFAGDTPSALAESTPLALGEGPGLCISADSSPVLMDMARKVAKDSDIPMQITTGRSLSGGTDAAALRLKRATATLNVNIPLRNMHTANEIVDVRDLNNTLRLIKGVLTAISELEGPDDLVPWK